MGKTLEYWEKIKDSDLYMSKKIQGKNVFPLCKFLAPKVLNSGYLSPAYAEYEKTILKHGYVGQIIMRNVHFKMFEQKHDGTPYRRISISSIGYDGYVPSNQTVTGYTIENTIFPYRLSYEVKTPDQSATLLQNLLKTHIVTDKKGNPLTYNDIYQNPQYELCQLIKQAKGDETIIIKGKEHFKIYPENCYVVDNGTVASSLVATGRYLLRNTKSGKIKVDIEVYIPDIGAALYPFSDHHQDSYYQDVRYTVFPQTCFVPLAACAIENFNASLTDDGEVAADDTQIGLGDIYDFDSDNQQDSETKSSTWWLLPLTYVLSNLS